MHRSRTSRLPALVALLALGACGGGDAEARASDVSSTPGGPAPSVSAADAGGASAVVSGADAFEVTLSGPPYAGTHRVDGDLKCMVFQGLWQAGWEGRHESGLSALLVQLKEIPASGGASDKLALSVVFGSQDDPDGMMAVIDVHGSEFGRDGRATVTRDGGAAVLRVEGTAQHGARVTAELRCASVDVMS